MAFVDGCLPALHALTTGTGHPDSLLKAQLLTAGGDRGRKQRTLREKRKKRRRELKNVKIGREEKNIQRNKEGLGETEESRVI